MRPQAWRPRAQLVVALCVLVGLVAASCYGESAIEGGPDVSASANTSTSTAGEVPADLVYLGDLVGAAAVPQTFVMDASGSSVGLGDGTMLQVAAGAFTEPTELTATVFDLGFDQYLENPPWGVVYVLSTDRPVELPQPVAIEIPRSADTLAVMQLRDGQARVLDLEPGDVTRVEIDHFSEVSTVAVARPSPDTRSIGPPPTGDSPAAFLTACIFTLRRMWETDYEPGVPAERLAEIDSNNEFAAELAYSTCASALVRRFSPDNTYVSVACVGDRIGPGVDFLAAIDLCVAGGEEPPRDETESPPAAVLPEEPTVEPRGEVAVYVGAVPRSAFENESSEIRLELSSDGVVGGTFSLQERLDQGLANEEGSCPVTVDWTADLASLTFEGEAPFSGQIAGSIQISWMYTALEACTAPEPQTIDLALAGTATPERIDVTEPFPFALTRQP